MKTVKYFIILSCFKSLLRRRFSTLSNVCISYKLEVKMFLKSAGGSRGLKPFHYLRLEAGLVGWVDLVGFVAGGAGEVFADERHEVDVLFAVMKNNDFFLRVR